MGDPFRIQYEVKVEPVEDIRLHKKNSHYWNENQSA